MSFDSVSRFSTSGTRLPRETHTKPPKTPIKQGYPPRTRERNARARADHPPVPPIPRPLPPAPLALPEGGKPHAGAGVATSWRRAGTRRIASRASQTPQRLQSFAKSRPRSTGDSGWGQGFAPPPHCLSATALHARSLRSLAVRSVPPPMTAGRALASCLRRTARPAPRSGWFTVLSVAHPPLPLWSRSALPRAR